MAVPFSVPHPFYWMPATQFFSTTNFRKNDLPELVSSRPETAGAGKQIVNPHALKLLVVGILDITPVIDEVSVPCYQGGIVVGTEAVPVFQNEDTFGGLCNLPGGGQHRIRENIFRQPGVH